MATQEELEYIESNIDRVTYGFPVFNLATIKEAGLTVDYDRVEECADIDNNTGRLERYQTYRDWYNGEHKTDVSNDQKDLLEASGIPFSDNFTDIIVDSLIDRLELKGFSFTPENEIADVETTRISRKNKLDILNAKLHHICVKLGDSFAILDYDMKRKVVSIVCNRPDNIRPEYSDENGDILEWVSKKWDTSEVSIFNPSGAKITRLNIYYPNRIEKYYRTVESKNAWTPFMDQATDTLWPVPWVNLETNEPLGIPVFHFKNKTLDENFGVSEIRKAIPQQALLNKALLDLDLVLDKQGYPQRWGTGISSTNNNSTSEDGNSQSEFDGEPGSVWTTPNENAKFGQFESAEVNGMLSAIEVIVMHISATNATPIWLLLNSGRFPSGESMKMGDSGLSTKAANRAKIFGDTWEGIIRYSHMLRNIFAVDEVKAEIEEDTLIESIWKDTTPRNEKEAVEVLQGLKELGASNRYCLEQFGVQNVNEVLAQAAEEKDVDIDTQSRVMNRGVMDTPDITNMNEVMSTEEEVA